MLNTPLLEFAERWIEKAESYKANDLKATFDKFFSLFVVYNTLYNEATNRLIAQGEITPNQKSDSKSATDHAPRYIGYKNLTTALLNNHQSEINIITKLINDGTFYICCKKTPTLPTTLKTKNLSPTSLANHLQSFAALC